eukprot:TRINITY_DN20195_c0_g1_i3.p1 TRINITY_DN20195_c0_g1~~TRINITY_DN20195_c0_g1_i3.p1  ORF type:complete len:127 (+),score=0.18 TRINITY_DN20195_c0_g1_i3:240-620(+)
MYQHGLGPTPFCFEEIGHTILYLQLLLVYPRFGTLADNIPYITGGSKVVEMSSGLLWKYGCLFGVKYDKDLVPFSTQDINRLSLDGYRWTFRKIQVTNNHVTTLRKMVMSQRNVIVASIAQEAILE